MAQYKVPQDVEADDKLLGPFSFRQFVYLLIAGALIAVAVGLFQIFPLLAIVPVPPILLFAALALPLKKDQPMETYLAALVSYYLKPRRRLWTPGQRESTIQITAPKIEEDSRTREITGEEATHRLSFLADIVDTQGYAIKGGGINQINEELIAEANATNDIFENNRFDSLGPVLSKDGDQRRAEVVKEMRETIAKTDNLVGLSDQAIEKRFESKPLESEPSEGNSLMAEPNLKSSVVVQPEVNKPETVKNVEQKTPKPSIIELANNDDFSVATISKEANRINQKGKGEVFISLR